MAKYKFELSPKIRGYIEWQLEHYHEDKKQIEQYKQQLMPSITASYSLVGGIQSGGTSDPTAQAALKMATSPYILETERCIKAIDKALSLCDETDIKLIDLVYWKRSYTISGAGYKAGLAKTSTYQRINKILGAIALELRLVNI